MDCDGTDPGSPSVVKYIKMRYQKMHFGCELKTDVSRCIFLLLKYLQILPEMILLHT